MKAWKFVLLNLTTILGILLGTASIAVAVFSDALGVAVLLIMASALIDRYDGRIARRYRLVSTLGARLDSANDVVTFAIAPAVLLAQGFFLNVSFLVAAITIYVLFGSFRLLRFHQREERTRTQGIPITPIGVLLSVLLWGIESRIEASLGSDLALFAFVLLLSFLMIAPFTVKKY